MDVYLIDSDTFTPNPTPYSFSHTHTHKHTIKHTGPIYVRTIERSVRVFDVQGGEVVSKARRLSREA